MLEPVDDAGQEARSGDPVRASMVEGEAEREQMRGPASGGRGAAGRTHPPDTQDRKRRGQQDGRKGIDRVGAQVGYHKRGAARLGQFKPAFSRAFVQIAQGGLKFGQAFRAGVLHARQHHALPRREHQPELDPVVETKFVAGQVGVQAGVFAERLRQGIDDVGADRDRLAIGLPPQRRHERRHVAFAVERGVGRLLLRLMHVAGGDGLEPAQTPNVIIGHGASQG